MRFQWKSRLSAKHLAAYIGGFFALRAASYVFTDALIFQALIVIGLCMGLASLYYKDRDTAIFLLIAELLLGGNGQYLELFGLSLRSALLITFILVWMLHLISSAGHRKEVYIPHRLFYIFLPAAVFILIGAVRGTLLGNGLVAVLQDTLPYLYFLLIPPLFHMIKRKRFQKELTALIVAFVFGTVLWELMLFILFTTGISIIHDPFYSWLRDAGAQKITDMHNGFFRIVAPVHLLIPLFLTVVYSLKLHSKKYQLWYLIIPMLLILVLDLSRAYALGAIVGYLLLFRKQYVADWIKVGLISLLITAGMFLALNLSASLGTSTGIELLTNRIQSFSEPEIEYSTYTRMAVLPRVWDMIIERPILGHGLGATITFPHPLSGMSITTRHFDWGLLELWAELGILGLASVLILIGSIIVALHSHILHAHHSRSVDRGVIAALMTLCFLGIFGPGLFHIYGILFITLSISMTLPEAPHRHDMLEWIHHKLHILPE